MKTRTRITALALTALGGVALLTGCSSASETTSYNLSKAADEFEIDRRIIFYNGITDQYILTVEGRCSITDDTNQLEVTCKIGPEEYKKHFLGLSDNVTYFVEQLDTANVSEYNYRVIFKPEAILPDIEVETKAGEGQ